MLRRMVGRQMIADLKRENKILFLNHLQIVTYSTSLFDAIREASRLKVTPNCCIAKTSSGGEDQWCKGAVLNLSHSLLVETSLEFLLS